jgi:hypothetical protein
VAIVPTGRHGVRATIREHPAESRRQLVSRPVQHSRRSTVTERMSNVRPPQWGDRTHNSRRHRSEPRWDDGHASDRAYRGAHRADDVASHDRSSRVGRHHAAHHHANRW